MIAFHMLLLFIAFTLRYNALLYPFISLSVLLASKAKRSQKLVGLVALIVLCGGFVSFTANKYKQLTGTWQYSPFSGWQWANNAMYTYRFVKKEKRKPVPQKFKELDNMVREYFDSTRDIRKHPQEALMASTVYMWEPQSTLFKFQDKQFLNDTSAKDLKKWASVAPFYKSYGQYIILQYPGYFLKYFIWPNAQKYYAPPIEFLDGYNCYRLGVLQIAQDWFEYGDKVVKPRFNNYVAWELRFYPIFTGVINVFMLLSLLLLAFMKVQVSPLKIITLGAVIWFSNAAFTITASSAALRFQSFPILLTTVVAVINISLIISFCANESKDSKNKLTELHFDPTLSHTII